MATDVILPELGENITGGTVTAILVKVGDTVDVDQPLLELETDKAVVEVPSSEAGVIAEINAQEGEKLNVGEVMLVLNGSASSAPKTEAPAEEKAPEPAVDGKRDSTEPVAHAKKESAPAMAPAEPKRPHPTPPHKPVVTEKELPPPAGKTVRAAPSVRKLAREIGVDISQVQPDNPGGRITADNVKKHAKQRLTFSTEGGGVVMASTPLPDFSKYGTVRREEMSQVRKITMESMTRSWTTIPHVTQNDKADVTELEKFRKQKGKQVQAAGAKLTATAILVKVLAEALQRFPQFNSSIDPAKEEIIFKEYYHIGVAVDTPAGLLVPNIKDVDQKSLVEISLELTGLSERARERKTKLDELQGTCMTITNLGGIGGTSFTPIVNAPEVAILGVSRSAIEPVYIDGDFQPRNMMPLSLSYDHRIVDGADAARFTRWICEVLEQPLNLFLD
jgi:pyruvate dehydrogenase E2 component (dihydrolipoamide acetyltransferase)